MTPTPDGGGFGHRRFASAQRRSSETCAAVRAGVIAALIILATVQPAHAQASSQRKVKVGGAGVNLPAADGYVDADKLPQQSDPTQLARTEFAGTPIPVVNPTIGNGAGGIGMLAIRLSATDNVSPPSLLGAGGLYTDSDSWAFGLFGNLFLFEDRFRLLVGGGDGHANYDFYGTGHDAGDDGLFVPISQSGSLFLVEPKVRVFERLFVGPRYRRLHTSVAIDFDALLDEIAPDLESRPDIPPRDVEATIASLGLRVQRDTRDSQFYPRAGGFADATADFFRDGIGSDREFDSYEAAYQGYHGIGDNNVVAYRAAVCAVSGDAPFYGLCTLGNSKDIRGYAVGVYQDQRMAVGQLEYRRELPWRLGLVAFFGLGQVAGTFGDFNGDDILPGGGIGVRFTLADQNHINVRVDYAWGRDSSALYVGLMEAF